MQSSNVTQNLPSIARITPGPVVTPTTSTLKTVDTFSKGGAAHQGNLLGSRHNRALLEILKGQAKAQETGGVVPVCENEACEATAALGGDDDCSSTAQDSSSTAGDSSSTGDMTSSPLTSSSSSLAESSVTAMSSSGGSSGIVADTGASSSPQCVPCWDTDVVRAQDDAYNCCEDSSSSTPIVPPWDPCVLRAATDSSEIWIDPNCLSSSSSTGLLEGGGGGGGLSHGGKIGIGVGVGVGVPALLLCCGLTWWFAFAGRRRQTENGVEMNGR